LANQIFNIDEDGTEYEPEPDSDGYVEAGTRAQIHETPLQRVLGLQRKEKIYPNAMMPTEGIDTASDKQKMLEVYDEIKKHPTPHGIFLVRGLRCNRSSSTPHDGIDLRDFEEYMMATNHVRQMHDVMRYHNARRVALMKGYASMEKHDRKMMDKGKPLG
jgi:hypothetical protein